ncbi:MAG TPA: PrgI family protein [Patescibacteria group bacterium]|nr:PrgI family protein [Patescibacteria group bacterium]
MATYKVIQDVEAEDKILGPLTLRQFIYAGIAAVCLYLTYFAATHKAGFLAAVFIPFAVITGFFAFPWGRDQPTEVWALAKIRYLLKPRRRIWDQSGVKELVTVTAPKRTQTDYTNGLSETEVNSRLRALADTLDSRGWAIKNANVNLYSQPALVMAEPSSDRLVSLNDFPQQVAAADVRPADDMLDTQNNAAAKEMDSKINASAKAHREKIMESLRQPAEPTPPPAPVAAPTPAAPPANNYWFLNQPGQAASVPNDMVTFNTQVVTPGAPGPEAPAAPTAPAISPSEEQQLVQTLEAKKRELPMASYYGHLHVVQPLSAQQQAAQNSQTAQLPVNAVPSMSQTIPAQPGAVQAPQGTPATSTQPAQAPVTPTQQAAILQLANNDDLNVATLAREAQRSGLPDGEVVIKLH